MTQPSPLPALFIGGVAVRQDNEGRYFLNDLHKAAGGLEKDKPVEFLRLKSTSELIDELRKGGFPTSDRINDLDPIRTVNSFTEEQGTYVVKELVYAYAMWINTTFMLHVIRTFDHVFTQQLVESNDKLLMMKTELRATIPTNKYLQLVERHDDLQEKFLEALQNQPPRFGMARAWREDEDIQAMGAWLQGLGYTRIGFPMGRTGDSVKHRFKRKLHRILPAFAEANWAHFQDYPRAQAVMAGGAA